MLTLYRDIYRQNLLAIINFYHSVTNHRYTFLLKRKYLHIWKEIIMIYEKRQYNFSSTRLKLNYRLITIDNFYHESILLHSEHFSLQKFIHSNNFPHKNNKHIPSHYHGDKFLGKHATSLTTRRILIHDIKEGTSSKSKWEPGVTRKESRAIQLGA